MRKSAIGILAVMLAGMAAVSAPVKSNVAGETIIRNGENLPYDAEVEYIESTGTQYIDTGVQPSSHSCVIRFQLTSFAGNPGYIAGVYNTNNRRFYVCLLNDNVFYVLNPSNIPLTSRNRDLNEHVVEYNMGSEGICRWDGATIGSINATFSGTIKNLYLFANNGAYGIVEFVYAKMFSGEIRDRITGILVRDFRPVRFTNEAGQREGAMYDRVTGELFRNQGTGAFGIGPDKK